MQDGVTDAGSDEGEGCVFPACLHIVCVVPPMQKRRALALMAPSKWHHDGPSEPAFVRPELPPGSRPRPVGCMLALLPSPKDEDGWITLAEARACRVPHRLQAWSAASHQPRAHRASRPPGNSPFGDNRPSC